MENHDAEASNSTSTLDPVETQVDEMISSFNLMDYGIIDLNLLKSAQDGSQALDKDCVEVAKRLLRKTLASIDQVYQAQKKSLEDSRSNQAKLVQKERDLRKQAEERCAKLAQELELKSRAAAAAAAAEPAQMPSSAVSSSISLQEGPSSTFEASGFTTAPTSTLGGLGGEKAVPDRSGVKVMSFGSPTDAPQTSAMQDGSPDTQRRSSRSRKIISHSPSPSPRTMKRDPTPPSSIKKANPTPAKPKTSPSPSPSPSSTSKTRSVANIEQNQSLNLLHMISNVDILKNRIVDEFGMVTLFVWIRGDPSTVLEYENTLDMQVASNTFVPILQYDTAAEEPCFRLVAVLTPRRKLSAAATDHQVASTIPLPSCANRFVWCAWQRHPLLGKSTTKGGNVPLRDHPMKCARVFLGGHQGQFHNALKDFFVSKEAAVSWQSSDARIEIALNKEATPEWNGAVAFELSENNRVQMSFQEIIERDKQLEKDPNFPALTKCFTLRHAALLLEAYVDKNTLSKLKKNQINEKTKTQKSQSSSNPSGAETSAVGAAPHLPEEKNDRKFLRMLLRSVYENALTRALFYSEKTDKLTLIVWCTPEIRPDEPHFGFLAPVLQYEVGEDSFLTLVGVIWPRAALTPEQLANETLDDAYLPRRLEKDKWCIWTEHSFLNEEYEDWSVREVKFGDTTPFVAESSPLAPLVKSYTRDSKRSADVTSTIEFVRLQFPENGEKIFSVEALDPETQEPVRISMPWKKLFAFDDQKVTVEATRRIVNLNIPEESIEPLYNYVPKPKKTAPAPKPSAVDDLPSIPSPPVQQRQRPDAKAPSESSDGANATDPPSTPTPSHLDKVWSSSEIRSLLDRGSPTKVTLHLWYSGSHAVVKRYEAEQDSSLVKKLSVLIVLFDTSDPENPMLEGVGLLTPRAILSPQQIQQETLPQIILPRGIDETLWCAWSQHPTLSEIDSLALLSAGFNLSESSLRTLCSLFGIKLGSRSLDSITTLGVRWFPKDDTVSIRDPNDSNLKYFIPLSEILDLASSELQDFTLTAANRLIELIRAGPDRLETFRDEKTDPQREGGPKKRKRASRACIQTADKSAKLPDEGFHVESSATVSSDAPQNKRVKVDESNDADQQMEVV